MTVQEVVLHIGMGKTGSSALQVAFVRNRKLLGAHGIRYPEFNSDRRALEGGTVSGNGVALASYLAAGPESTDEQAKSVLAALSGELLTADATTLLYSSEMLFYFDVDRLSVFHQWLAERGVRLRVMTFVRDVTGHALSSYAQMVKRSRYTDSLDVYLRGYAMWPEGLSMGPRLQALVEEIGRENTVTAHYDTARRRLVETFMSDVFGIDDLAGFDLTRDEVNRSLSAQETEWMRQLNTRLEAGPGAFAISEQLIKRPPLNARRLTATREELVLLEDRFGAEVDWINHTFFPDLRLSVTGDAEIVTERGEAEVVTPAEVYLLSWIADIANAQAREDVKRRKARSRRRAQAADATAGATSGDATSPWIRARRRMGRARNSLRSNLATRRG